jgi:hypothetical protein
MSNTLLDRPARTAVGSVVAGRAPRRRSGRAVKLAGAAAVAVLAVAGADRAMDLLPSVENPLEERVIDTQRPALMTALSNLSDYHASQGAFQVVVDLERETPYVPGFVKGERTTYLASGTVDGVVDFRGLGDGAVQVQGQSVVITLPPPRLDEPTVDVDSSRVVARDRGLVDRVSGALSDSPTSERDVALLAERKLADAAAQSDVLARAQDNTRALLTELARSFGYTDVTVRFDGDASV